MKFARVFLLVFCSFLSGLNAEPQKDVQTAPPANKMSIRSEGGMTLLPDESRIIFNESVFMKQQNFFLYCEYLNMEYAEVDGVRQPQSLIAKGKVRVINEKDGLNATAKELYYDMKKETLTLFGDKDQLAEVKQKDNFLSGKKILINLKTSVVTSEGQTVLDIDMAAQPGQGDKSKN